MHIFVGFHTLTKHMTEFGVKYTTHTRPTAIGKRSLALRWCDEKGMGPSGRFWKVNSYPLGDLRWIFAEAPANDCRGKRDGGLWWVIVLYFGATLVGYLISTARIFVLVLHLFGRGRPWWLPAMLCWSCAVAVMIKWERSYVCIYIYTQYVSSFLKLYRIHICLYLYLQVCISE